MDKHADHAYGADRWDSAEAYEPYVGLWSHLVAREFVKWLAAPPGGRWLDVGCGTGALIQAALARAAPSEVVGVDPSETYIASASARIDDPRARFDLGDIQALRVATATLDVVVSGLVLNFVPQPDRAVTEMARVARPGGTVVAYVWDHAEGMGLIRYFWDAAVALDPKAKEMDEGRRFSLCKPEPLYRLFLTAGLEGVRVRAIEVPTYFRDFDDYWSPFLGGQGPAPTYAMSLSEQRRVELRDQIQAKLPGDSYGGIPSALAHGPIGSVR